VLHRTNIVVWPLGTAPGTLRWCRCEFLMLLCDWDYSAVQQGIEGTNDFTQLISSFICWRLEILALELWRVSKNKENQTQSLPGIRDQLLEANHWPSTGLSESLWLTLSHLLSQRTPILIPFHQCRSRQESLNPVMPRLSTSTSDKWAYRPPLPSIPWLAEESAETPRSNQGISRITTSSFGILKICTLVSVCLTSLLSSDLIQFIQKDFSSELPLSLNLLTSLI